MSTQRQSEEEIRKRLLELLDYIREQAQRLNVHSFDLSRHKGFLRRRADIERLPRVQLNVYAEDDHWWLVVPRLRAEPPPRLDQKHERLILVADDPSGPEPEIDEDEFKRVVAAQQPGPGSAREWEDSLRKELAGALEQYRLQWKAWSEKEQPRRSTIALYRDLFAIRQQIESDETARPIELVWGIGMAFWAFSAPGQNDGRDRRILAYPLLTQSMEIGLDEHSLELYLRPRDDAKARYEGEFFALCDVPGELALRRQIQQYLDQLEGGLVNPFDSNSYGPLLKLVAAQLDARGSYQETPSCESEWPDPGQHLQVRSDWVLFVRPRHANFLIEDLQRRGRLSDSGGACGLRPDPRR